MKLLAAGELKNRVEKLENLLEACSICPKDCGNNRLQDEIAACYSGRLPVVSSYTAHFGEEPCLSGDKGTGNIFFGNCNLRCVYCQNYQISQTWKTQKKNEVSHERLAEMMLELQAKGCHNIGFVSPTHFAPQMARAILIAAENGLNLPIVYNTNAYDSVEVLKLLDGIVDVYLPDLKYADDAEGFVYSKVRGYKTFAREAIKEMFRQTGDVLVFDENGLLQKGLLIRLLVLPNDLAGIEESLRWIKEELSPKVAVSLMVNTTRPTKPRPTRVTFCFPEESPNANGLTRSPCSKILKWKKALCRNTNRLRIIIAPISPTRKNLLRIFGTFNEKQNKRNYYSNDCLFFTGVRSGC